MSTIPSAVLLDSMGDDMAVVNAARVSFDKESTYEVMDHVSEEGQITPVRCISAADKQLIEYLATGLRRKERAALIDAIIEAGNRAAADELIDRIQGIQKHYTPFAHCVAKFRVNAPIFVARQLLRSEVGLTPSGIKIDLNEVSRRYVDDEPEIFDMMKWRRRGEDVKQGSGGEFGPEMQASIDAAVQAATDAAVMCYSTLVEDVKVAPEQARSVLPLSLMTQWIWTGSLYAFARVCHLRLDSHAQAETRAIAADIDAAMSQRFPISWAALLRKKSHHDVDYSPKR